MKKIRIGIDVDSVIADFENSFINEFNKMTNKTLLKTDITDWNYQNAINKIYNGEIDGEIANKIIFAPEFVLNLPFIDNAKEVLLELLNNEHYEPVIITAIPSELIEYRNKWFKKHFNDIEFEIHYTDKKDTVNIDYLIDDAEHNLDALQHKIGKDNCLCIQMNYNKNADYKMFDKLESAIKHIKIKEGK